jgi:hypothetical protein
VTSTSPSRRVSTGKRSSMERVVRGRMTQKSGGLKLDWHRLPPSALSRMQAKSWLSPTIVLNEVLMTALSTSSMMLMRRCHWISSWIRSISGTLSLMLTFRRGDGPRWGATTRW